MKSLRTSAVRRTAWAVAAFVLFSMLGRAQDTTAIAAPPTRVDAATAVRDLQDQVRQLRSLVEEMRAENAESRAEMHQLRQDLQSTRALLERPTTTPTGAEANTIATAPEGKSPTPARCRGVPCRSPRTRRAKPLSKNEYRSWKNRPLSSARKSTSSIRRRLRAHPSIEPDFTGSF